MTVVIATFAAKKFQSASNRGTALNGQRIEAGKPGTEDYVSIRFQSRNSTEPELSTYAGKKKFQSASNRGTALNSVFLLRCLCGLAFQSASNRGTALNLQAHAGAIPAFQSASNRGTALNMR